MNWFKKAYIESHSPSKADWIKKNTLMVTIGDDVEVGDKLFIDVAVANNVDIYPGWAGIADYPSKEEIQRLKKEVAGLKEID
jgi:hypothetical protein